MKKIFLGKKKTRKVEKGVKMKRGGNKASSIYLLGVKKPWEIMD